MRIYYFPLPYRYTNKTKNYESKNRHKYFDTLLNSPLKDFDKVTVIQLPQTLIPSDVLERIEGMETFTDTDTTLNEKIYSTSKLYERIVCNKEDDTNETTKVQD